MNVTIRIALAAAALLASSPVFACDYPQRPSIPPGSTASKEEMLTAKNDVQAFLGAVDEYLRCIEADEKAALDALDDPAPEEVKRREDLLNKKFDAANEEKALIGEQFNQQVRAYNSKRKAAE
jgi:hypothetical protein